MLHAVYFSEGRALAYHNHWIRCPRWFAERAHKGALWLRVRWPCAYSLSQHPLLP